MHGAVLAVLSCFVARTGGVTGSGLAGPRVASVVVRWYGGPRPGPAGGNPGARPDGYATYKALRAVDANSLLTGAFRPRAAASFPVGGDIHSEV